jgi:hypothetical protein
MKMNENEINKENEEIDKLLTSVEVANKLRISTATLANFRERKTGPAYIRVGRQFKYPYKALVEYIKKLTTI